jgi:hypothetical protein
MFSYKTGVFQTLGEKNMMWAAAGSMDTDLSDKRLYGDGSPVARCA